MKGVSRMLDDILQWLINNKEWIFSGIGVFIIGLVISIITKRKSKTKSHLNIVEGSNNITLIGSKNTISMKTPASGSTSTSSLIADGSGNDLGDEEQANENQKNNEHREDKDYLLSMQKLRLENKPSVDFDVNQKYYERWQNFDTYKILCDRIFHMESADKYQIIQCKEAEIPKENENVFVYPIEIKNNGAGNARYGRLELEFNGGARTLMLSSLNMEKQEKIVIAFTFSQTLLGSDIEIKFSAYYEDIFGNLYCSGMTIKSNNSQIRFTPQKTTLKHLGEEMKSITVATTPPE